MPSAFVSVGLKKCHAKDECCQIKKGIKEMPQVWGIYVGQFP